MKRILGIDLGTSNSCVAIPSDNAEGKVIIVRDDKGRATVPSVVMRNNDGEYIVGHLAKQRVGTKANPVSFIKRYMGKIHTVDVGGVEMSPEQVSAKIIEYLAKLAKERTGEEFKQAVITIPARFELPGQQATIEAAKLAGLEVLTTMPEPVAAALAYGLQDEKDDVKIFCYDLGGGTFDATVMRKNRDLGIEVMAFDGDPQLGGYNFDTELAKWILTKLQKKYSLNLDWDSPEDNLRFQKLMVLAEKTKTTLSEELECNIFKDEIFNDHDGEPINVEMTISRDEFQKLISPYIADSIIISLRALEKAKVKPQDIDRVILVGGSSRIPIVPIELSKVFATKPQLVDPDTIVAKGAAIKASSLTGNITEGIEFLSDIPKTCPLDSFDVYAKVTIPEPAGGLPVILEREDGGYEGETETDENGQFCFHEIPLVEDNLNEFELIVGDPDTPKLRYGFSVLQNREKEANSNLGIVNFVTQDINLLLSTGFMPVFREGENIPGNKQVTLRSVQDNELFLRFDVYNGNQHIGEVMIDDIPSGLPAGSKLHLDITITDDLKINGTTTLAKTGQSVPFSFRIPKPKQMNLKEMRTSFADLQKEYEESLEVISDDLTKAEFMGKGEKFKAQLNSEFSKQPTDDAKTQRLISEFTGLIQEISVIDVLKPPFGNFEQTLAEARQLLPQAESKKPDKIKAENYPEKINGIETFGRDAFEIRNKSAWKAANEQIEKVVGEILYIINQKEMDNISPEVLAVYLYNDTEKTIGNVNAQLKKALAQKTIGPKFEKFKPQLTKLINDFNDVNQSEAGTTLRECKRLNSEAKALSRKIEEAGGVAI